MKAKTVSIEICNFATNIAIIFQVNKMNFTERFGVPVPQADITVRYEAPTPLRNYLFQVMQKYEPSLTKIRTIVCLVTKEGPDPNNWGENNFMRSEIQELINNCLWNRVYDLIEEFSIKLQKAQRTSFEKEVNDYFIERGIGWKILDGHIETRGDEMFEKGMKGAVSKLEEKKLQTSSNELKEAIADLSRRPDPEKTGAVQHSLAALECVCREVSGDKKATLGTLISKHSQIIPKPLDDAIQKIWGFSSNHGRHLNEGAIPPYEEAELLVHLSASLCTYLVSKFNISG